MKPGLSIFLLLVLLLCSSASFAAVSKKKFAIDGAAQPSATTPVNVDVVPAQGKSPAVKSHDFCLSTNFANQQKKLRENIAQKISAMKNGDRNVLWAFLAICFLYGMLHALGPGHGKSIVVGYFLARNGRWRHGVALGAGITFAHTLSAVLLLLILYAILKAAVFPTFEVGRQGIEKVSYGLVSFTGVLLVGIAIHDLVGLIKKKRNAVAAGNGGVCNEVALSKKASWKELIGVAAVTGIVPCPAVALIVLFCLLNSMVALSLASAAVICVGMTVTNILFGVIAVAMKKGIDAGASKTGWFAGYIHIIASFAGGLVVFLAGLFMMSTIR